MTSIAIFTGSAGPDITMAAAAMALAGANHGGQTLLFSVAGAPALSALLEAPVAGTPRQVAPGLDALALDPLAELSALWERERARLPGQLGSVASDELPLPAGLDALLALQRLAAVTPRYRLVVVDAGPYDQLLRALALPDSLRWGVRLLFGLDRGPGRSPASITRAMLPSSFIPVTTRDHIQNLRVELEQGRTQLFDPARTRACYVLGSDAPAHATAHLAIAALQLHGLAVPMVLVGPLLPDDTSDPRLASHVARQSALLAKARQLWAPRTIHSFTIADAAGGLDGLRLMGQQARLEELPPTTAPVAYQHQGVPAVVIDLPALPKDALQLTLSGDELIVRIGPYRRHLLLPDGLRGIASIKATREGTLLIVQRR